jgi:hypothetical protein
MRIEVEKIYGKTPSTHVYGVLQVHGRVNGEPLAYSVQPFAGSPLNIPRLIMVRRSSWAAKYGDSNSLPF